MTTLPTPVPVPSCSAGRVRESCGLSLGFALLAGLPFFLVCSFPWVPHGPVLHVGSWVLLLFLGSLFSETQNLRLKTLSEALR
jgi:hypothetical protein